MLKNAGEGIAARIAKGDDAPGRIAHRAASRNGRTTFAFRVTDNGVGLPPEHRHRLTEPYVTTRAKGTGLGPGDRAQDHGRPWRRNHPGRCREAGRGREVTLTFPFVAKEPSGRKEVKMSKNGSLIASEILVVDDEEDIRDLISGILQRRGL